MRIVWDVWIARAWKVVLSDRVLHFSNSSPATIIDPPPHFYPHLPYHHQRQPTIIALFWIARVWCFFTALTCEIKHTDKHNIVQTYLKYSFFCNQWFSVDLFYTQNQKNDNEIRKPNRENTQHIENENTQTQTCKRLCGCGRLPTGRVSQFQGVRYYLPSHNLQF